MGNRFFLVLVLLSFSAKGQNLILNPSFEAYRKCPKELTEKKLKLKDKLVSVKGSPDYFHYCSETYSPENNPFGSQKPHDGEAFCGLVLTSDYPDECADREYLQLKLSEPLEAGKKYLFSMQISLADTSGYYTDQIGVYFLKEKFTKKQSIRSFYGKAAISNPPDSFMENAKDWIELKGIYNAKGGEEYILLGNFQYCNKTSRKAVLSNGFSELLKNYEDENYDRGSEPNPAVLENMKRKFREDISGSTLKAYNLAYYFIDDLSLTPYYLNDSLSVLKPEQACFAPPNRPVNKENLVNDGAFMLNKEEGNPYWKSASNGTPDFFKNRVGLYLYSDVGKNNREYIITELKEQLSPCKRYYFSIKVKRNQAYRFTVDQLQAAAIDSNYFVEDRMRFDFQPFFSSPRNSIIENTEDWLRLCAEFKPSSCANFLVIGNFSSDDSTFVFPAEYSLKDGPYAYYFIDDIELFELGLTENCEEPCQVEVQAKEIPEETVQLELITVDSLLFYFESSSFYTSNKIERGQFEKYIQALEQDSSLKIVVAGHADKSGNEAKNRILSKKRAEGIYAYLLQMGIPKSSLNLEYFGSQRPRQPNRTKEGRSLNRRVEVYLSSSTKNKQ